MDILGVNLTRTSTGTDLYDGAAVLLRDGVPMVAIAEERLTRAKHCGSVRLASQYCLDAAGTDIRSVDYVAVSICCEVPPPADWAAHSLRLQGLDVRDDQVVVVPSHHLSHAASAFLASPFQQAITVVADNEGNILGPRTRQEYWLNSLERTTVWACTSGIGTEIRRIASHGDQPDEISLGAAYNYITKWLGFSSYHDAGQTMALAAHATGKWSDSRLFEWEAGRLLCRLPQRNDAKVEAVAGWLNAEFGIPLDQGRDPGEPITELHHEVAGLAQSALERALLDLVRRAVEETGIRTVCLAGGSALNCVANHRIARELDLDGLFIQPAASDVGQALGNALWTWHCLLGQTRRWAMNSAALGRPYEAAEVRRAAEEYAAHIDVEPSPDVVGAVASRLAQGQIVGWFSGGSEYGIRALGQRSILGDPRRLETKTRLDLEIKCREPFRPYAPSVTAESASEWFDLTEREIAPGAPATFMLQAAPVRRHLRFRIPAVVHVDGTARVHVVHPGQNADYHALIERFRQLTGIPVLLNTSFNAAGNPIVETPGDAIAEFLAMGLDCLLLDGLLITPRRR
ncbi:carbamoyltransferase family protein [Kitasatospora azatica]|uniref:carbamoyltransferase family protein n=1 Tax=Kitasatospora azatica TaxID=58347 RepID=UPI00068C0D71|nr:carbamoyltransferase C-terminal domain-containing protein [Kitasatospora azatica]